MNTRHFFPRLGDGITALICFLVAGIGAFLWIKNYDSTFFAEVMSQNRPVYFRFIVPGHEFEIPGRIGLLLLIMVPTIAFAIGLASVWSAMSEHEEDAA